MPAWDSIDDELWEPDQDIEEKEEFKDIIADILSPADKDDDSDDDDSDSDDDEALVPSTTKKSKGKGKKRAAKVKKERSKAKAKEEKKRKGKEKKREKVVNSDSEDSEEEEEAEEDDNDDEEEEEDEELSEDSIDEYGEDLIKDEEDRQKLDQMTVLMREGVIYERANRRKERIQRQEAKAQYRKQQEEKRKQRGKAGKKKKDKSKRDKDTSVAKTREKRSKREDESERDLERIARKRRKKEEEEEEYNEMEEEDDNEGVGEEEEAEEEEEASESEEKTQRRGGRYIDEDSDEDDEERKEGEMDDLDDEAVIPLRLRDVQSLQIRRYALEKMIQEPYMKDIIKDKFARLNVGTDSMGKVKYRLVEIKDLHSFNKYKFAGKSINQGLLLRVAKNERVFPMTLISNSGITEDEFTKWKTNMEKQGCRVISSQEALKKKKATLDFRRNFKYTADIVSKMVVERKKNLKKVNVTRELFHLEDEIMMAQENGDEDTLNKLTKKKDDLIEEESMRRRRHGAAVEESNDGKNKFQEGLLTLNKKMLKKARDNALNLQAQVVTFVDPFERKKTLSTSGGWMKRDTHDVIINKSKDKNQKWLERKKERELKKVEDVKIRSQRGSKQKKVNLLDTEITDDVEKKLLEKKQLEGESAGALFQVNIETPSDSIYDEKCSSFKDVEIQISISETTAKENVYTLKQREYRVEQRRKAPKPYFTSTMTLPEYINAYEQEGQT